MKVEFSQKYPSSAGMNLAFSSTGISVELTPEDLNLDPKLPADIKALRLVYEARRIVYKQMILDGAISPEAAKVTLQEHLDALNRAIDRAESKLEAK